MMKVRDIAQIAEQVERADASEVEKNTHFSYYLAQLVQAEF